MSENETSHFVELNQDDRNKLAAELKVTRKERDALRKAVSEKPDAGASEVGGDFQDELDYKKARVDYKQLEVKTKHFESGVRISAQKEIAPKEESKDDSEAKANLDRFASLAYRLSNIRADEFSRGGDDEEYTQQKEQQYLEDCEQVMREMLPLIKINLKSQNQKNRRSAMYSIRLLIEAWGAINGRGNWHSEVPQTVWNSYIKIQTQVEEVFTGNILLISKDMELDFGRQNSDALIAVLSEGTRSPLVFQLAKKLFVKHQKQFEERSLEDEKKDWQSYNLPYLVAYGTDEVGQKATERMLALDKEDDKNSAEHAAWLGKAIGKLISLSREGYAREISNAVLKKYGIENLGLYEAWVESSSGRPGEGLESNFSSALILEKKSKGIVNFLVEEYNLKDFARYDQKLLLRQREVEDDAETPYGLVINPYSDHNSAFNHEVAINNPDIAQSLARQLEGRYHLRFAEIKNKGDLARLLLKLEKKYGAKHKISFAIVGGHGTKDGIIFGDQDKPGDTLTVKDIVRSRVKRARQFFESGAIIVLISCSTGQRQGIAEEMKDELDLELIAPDTETSPESINAALSSQGKLERLDVRYKKGKTMVYKRE